MKINPDIFRAYDIRGTYPDELNEEVAFAVGKGFVTFLKKEARIQQEELSIVVGRDMRLSSPILFEQFARGAISEGCTIIDAGLITTPMLYFAVSHFGYDGGAMITASHNPNPHNGIKLTREKAIPLGGDTGIFWIRDYVQSMPTAAKDTELDRRKIVKKSIEEEYLAFNLVLADVQKDEFKNFSVAVDAGNGVGGPMLTKILQAIGATVYPLHMDPDGRFPHHVPDPLIRKNIEDLILLIKEKKPDLGVALDGDADRIVFIDEQGEPIRGDLITALMAQIILQQEKFRMQQQKILYDVRSSNIVAEKVQQFGGVPVASRIGHSLIKATMRKEDILFGGELSGHYYWGDGLFFEVPFVVFLRILKALRERRVPFSHFIQPFQVYAHSGEINFSVQAKEQKIAAVRAYFRTGQISELDGLRVDFPDWWFLVRSSNTEPLLRLVIEANSQELLEEKKKELAKIIEGEES
ncbi:MAG: phosphomannomutase/phosphoglucomutase [Candidatus Wildermuthbacteria bacterium]|nr:phosphomannomutase/phosphoglucomutase [Candidatus Wildermuthbacteria bacterium]